MFLNLLQIRQRHNAQEFFCLQAGAEITAGPFQQNGLPAQVKAFPFPLIRLIEECRRI